jgi:hypothetical protein
MRRDTHRSARLTGETEFAHPTGNPRQLTSEAPGTPYGLDDRDGLFGAVAPVARA